MARMIPPQIPHDCRSPGEKLLFNRLKEDPESRDWVVLHSLGVARHPCRVAGEIDFVVIIQGVGILCLEVKAGNVIRQEGLWRYGSGPFAEVSYVGPFKQASEAMHAVRKHVFNVDPSLSRLLFFSGVFFTYIDFDEKSTEWHSWQYADRSMLSKNPVSMCCLRILENAHEYIRQVPSAIWYDPALSRPTRDQVKKLVNILRGDFEYFVSSRTIVEGIERQIRHFTEEQFVAIDVLEENDRVLFKGPAGTGKTLLAIETARRSVMSGRKTLFVCYNKILGNWLASEMQTFSKTYPGLLTVGTLHSILLKLSGLQPPSQSEAGFWSKTLPQTVVEGILLGSINAPLYQTLIVDEAQDLLTEQFLDALDLLLDGGMAGGHWAMFGDLERQAIYTRQEIDGALDVPSTIKRRAPIHFKYPLRINCRNTERISSGIELACKLSPPYKRVLHAGNEADIEIGFYGNSQEQIGLLRNHLEHLEKTFHPSEIVILSAKEDKSSCAGLIYQQNALPKLKPLRQGIDMHTSIYFTTIHSFKGMEASAVILTDIEKIVGEGAEALLYIGMSRARLQLIMLMSESCRMAYVKNVRESFISLGRREKNGDKS